MNCLSRNTKHPCLHWSPLRTTCSSRVHVVRGCMECKLLHPSSSRWRSPVHDAKGEKSSMLLHIVMTRCWRLAHLARGDRSLIVGFLGDFFMAHPSFRHLSPESLSKPVKSTGTARLSSSKSARWGQAASGERSRGSNRAECRRDGRCGPSQVASTIRSPS
jgi:hypothetical protein